jgi:tetratricopeptide (TPR) repeat protein
MGKGKTDLEKLWDRRGGLRLNDLYQKRKKRDQLSLAAMGERLGFSQGAQTSSINSIIRGKGHLTPEYIQELARFLSGYASRDPDDPDSSLAIEASLAVYSGQMPPFVAALEEKHQQGVFGLISDFSLLGLEMESYRESSIIIGSSPWLLVQKELMDAIQGWLKIRQFEEYISSLDEYKINIEMAAIHWQPLAMFLEGSRIPIQYAYANVLWARTLTRAGHTRLAEEHAHKAIAVLNQYTGLPEELIPLKFQAQVILGDNERVRSHFEQALEHYRKARVAVSGFSNGGEIQSHLSGRLDIKEFNTHLLAMVSPPGRLVERMKRLSSSEQVPPAMKSRALNSLAWYERSRGGRESLKAVDYNRASVYHASCSGDIHRQAVANQYFGETLLHMGNLVEARVHLETALQRHPSLHHGRQGFTNFLLGRVHAYLALRAAIQGSGECTEEIFSAMSSFGMAEAKFSSRVGQSVTGTYQRTQLLIEQSKWEAVNAFLSASQRQQELVKGAPWISKDSASDLPSRLEAARKKLREAEQRLDPEPAASQRNRFMIWVNELIIDFLHWLALEPKNYQRCGELAALAERRLESLPETLSIPRGFTQEAGIPFSQEMAGHRARISAVSAALSWVLKLGGRHTGEFYLENSVLYASQGDFLSIIESWWLASLVIESDYVRSVYRKKLEPEMRACLDHFFAKGSSGYGLAL